MGQQNSAEAIVGDSPVTEGLNISYESERVVSKSWPQYSGQLDKWISAPFFGIVDAVEGA